MKCVVFNGIGGNEVVSIESRPDPVPGKLEVLIATQYTGVNPADVLQREGRHPVPAGSPTDVPGLEVAGTIIACGDSVTAFGVGDRVFGLVGGGGHADRVVAHERELARVPETLDPELAASTPEAFITAFDALCVQAGLGAGDRLLVNGASGGVGLAAVQLGHILGAQIVANVRSETRREAVAALGATALGADEAFALMQELGGADIVLELVGGVHMPQNLEALALGGTIMIVAGKPGDEAVLSIRDVMGKRARMIGTTMRRRALEQRATLIQQFARRVVPLLAQGRVTPIVDRVFALDAATEAFDYVRQPGKLGKVLLQTG